MIVLSIALGMAVIIGLIYAGKKLKAHCATKYGFNIFNGWLLALTVCAQVLLGVGLVASDPDNTPLAIALFAAVTLALFAVITKKTSFAASLGAVPLLQICGLLILAVIVIALGGSGRNARNDYYY